MWQIPLLKWSLLPSFLRSNFLLPESYSQSPNMRLQHLSLSSLAATVSATNLWVSSYSGTVTTLQLNALSSGAYSLTTTATNTGCGGSPSWLTKNDQYDVLHCVDEGMTTRNGSVSSFQIGSTGALTSITKHDSLPGGVASTIYNGGKALAVAH